MVGKMEGCFEKKKKKYFPATNSTIKKFSPFQRICRNSFEIVRVCPTGQDIQSFRSLSWRRPMRVFPGSDVQGTARGKVHL